MFVIYNWSGSLGQQALESYSVKLKKKDTTRYVLHAPAEFVLPTVCGKLTGKRSTSLYMGSLRVHGKDSVMFEPQSDLDLDGESVVCLSVSE